MTITTKRTARSFLNISYDQRRIDRIHLTAAIPLLAIKICNRKENKLQLFCKAIVIKPLTCYSFKAFQLTLLMTRVPPKRRTNSSGVATVKSLSCSLGCITVPWDIEGLSTQKNGRGNQTPLNEHAKPKRQGDRNHKYDTHHSYYNYAAF